MTYKKKKPEEKYLPKIKYSFNVNTHQHLAYAQVWLPVENKKSRQLMLIQAWGPSRRKALQNFKEILYSKRHPVS